MVCPIPEGARSPSPWLSSSRKGDEKGLKLPLYWRGLGAGRCFGLRLTGLTEVCRGGAPASGAGTPCLMTAYVPDFFASGSDPISPEPNCSLNPLPNF